MTLDFDDEFNLGNRANNTLTWRIKEWGFLRQSDFGLNWL